MAVWRSALLAGVYRISNKMSRILGAMDTSFVNGAVIICFVDLFLLSYLLNGGCEDLG